MRALPCCAGTSLLQGLAARTNHGAPRAVCGAGAAVIHACCHPLRCGRLWVCLWGAGCMPQLLAGHKGSGFGPSARACCPHACVCLGRRMRFARAGCACPPRDLFPRPRCWRWPQTSRAQWRRCTAQASCTATSAAVRAASAEMTWAFFLDLGSSCDCRVLVYWDQLRCRARLR